MCEKPELHSVPRFAWIAGAVLLAVPLAAAAIYAEPAMEILVNTRSGIGFVDAERGTLVESELRGGSHGALGLLGDCSAIAVVANHDIFVVDRLHGTKRQLTKGLHPRSVALSPGGDQLAFVSGITGELHTVDVRTGRVVQLTSELGAPSGKWPEIGAPAWSPDGSRLAFPWEDRSTPTWRGALFVLDVQTGKKTAVTEQWWPYGLAGHSPWSPDGRRLAVSANVGNAIDGGSVILSLDEQPARVVESFENVDEVSWSPDGAYLALRDDTGFCGSIRVRDLRTGRETAITGGLFEYRCFDSPSWSPDSRHLAFTAYSSRGDMNPFPWPPEIGGQLYVSAIPAPARRLTADFGERTTKVTWCPVQRPRPDR